MHWNWPVARAKRPSNTRSAMVKTTSCSLPPPPPRPQQFVSAKSRQAARSSFPKTEPSGPCHQRAGTICSRHIGCSTIRQRKGVTMSSLKPVGVSFLLVLSWMWIVRLPDGSALAEVKDETAMFSSSAIQQADQDTRQIKQKYGKEMLVEVFAEIPADLRSQYSPDRKNQFFAQWMTRRSQELKVSGIYVLICRNPSHLQVDAGRDTKQRAFTAQNVGQLKNVLVTRFRDKKYDEGLSEAVNYVD